MVMPKGGHRERVHYDDDAAQHLLVWVAEGKSLKSWCDTDPLDSGKRFSVDVIYRWLRENEVFSTAYAYAKEDRADTLVDEMFEIAADATDDAFIDYREDGTPVAKINGRAMKRAQIEIDVRKWAAEKMRPATYGNKLDVTSGGRPIGAPIKDAAERMAQIFHAAMARKNGEDVPVVTVDAKFVDALPAPALPSLDALLS